MRSPGRFLPGRGQVAAPLLRMDPGGRREGGLRHIQDRRPGHGDVGADFGWGPGQALPVRGEQLMLDGRGPAVVLRLAAEAVDRRSSKTRIRPAGAALPARK